MEVCEQSLNDRATEQNLSNEFSQITFKQKLLNLHWDLPVPEKCCCCLPLRPGFLVLAYIKLVLSLALFLGILFFMFLVHFFISKTSKIFTLSLSWFAIFLDLVDIVIGILIIVNAHKKNVRLMEMYYRYSIYIFGLLIVICSVIYYMVIRTTYSLLLLLLFFILIMLMQIYLILLVRGEVLKLRSTAKFQFLNNEPEPVCTYYSDVEN